MSSSQKIYHLYLNIVLVATKPKLHSRLPDGQEKAV